MNIQGVGESHCKQKDLQCEQHLCDQGAGLEAGCMPLRASASLNLHPGHFSCPTLIQDLAGRVEFGQEEFWREGSRRRRWIQHNLRDASSSVWFSASEMDSQGTSVESKVENPRGMRTVKITTRTTPSAQIPSTHLSSAHLPLWSWISLPPGSIPGSPRLALGHLGSYFRIALGLSVSTLGCEFPEDRGWVFWPFHLQKSMWLIVAAQ